MIHPKHALATIVGKLKDKSAIVVSTGGASLEVIANDIKGQSRPS